MRRIRRTKKDKERRRVRGLGGEVNWKEAWRRTGERGVRKRKDKKREEEGEGEVEKEGKEEGERQKEKEGKAEEGEEEG